MLSSQPRFWCVGGRYRTTLPIAAANAHSRSRRAFEARKAWEEADKRRQEEKKRLERERTETGSKVGVGGAAGGGADALAMAF